MPSKQKNKIKQDTYTQKLFWDTKEGFNKV